MTRLCMTLVVGLIATSVAGGQTQDESARGRAEIRWRLPSRYVPAGDWKVQMPFQIFDNVYYVGNEAVSSYLITTSDGLVLIDTTTALMVNGTLDNIRHLGFDPSDIEYVFITEAHEIHYGGAAQIKAETGATICMSAADWDFLEQAAAHADQPEYDWTTQVAPPRDHESQDGEVITVGDAMFTLHVTPGHTPGTSSFEYIAYDGDQSYRVLTPGGTGLSMSSEWTEEWVRGRERLKASTQHGVWAGGGSPSPSASAVRCPGARSPASDGVDASSASDRPSHRTRAADGARESRVQHARPLVQADGRWGRSARPGPASRRARGGRERRVVGRPLGARTGEGQGPSS